MMRQVARVAYRTVREDLSDDHLTLSRIDITKWPSGCEQRVHIDVNKPGTAFTAIFYLNDNFAGGNTFFHGKQPKEVQPARDSMVAFSGRAIPHGVRKVLSGSRYTMPMWFGHYDESAPFVNRLYPQESLTLQSPTLAEL